MKQFLALLESLITIVLVLAGVAGLSYRGFRDGGWFSQGVSKVADAYVTYPLIALGLTIALFFAIRAWRTRQVSGRRTKIFDYLVYVFMAAGIYFIGHYIITGSI